MAERILSRPALRDEHDRTEHVADAPDDSPAAAGNGKKPRTRKPAGNKPAAAKAPPKPRAPRRKAVKEPPRTFARWAVFDGEMKRVAVFEYEDEAGRDARLAKLREDRKGPLFVQFVKDSYDPPAADPVTAV